METEIMKFHIAQCQMHDIQDLVQAYTCSLSSPIDSYLESHIVKSKFYLVRANDQTLGYFSIFQDELLTQFYLHKQYKYLSQEIFFRVKKMQSIHAAYVPTCDEFFLSNALDDYKSVNKQAYFFQDSQYSTCIVKKNKDVSLELAKLSDVEIIVKHSGEFFDKLDESISRGHIYLARQGDNLVGFGILEPGILLKGYVSIGMYTVEDLRQRGYGTNILLLLKDIVYGKQLVPIAGCWYYNHNSKRTLENTGMYSETILLRISY